jgi:hypothetical protein
MKLRAEHTLHVRSAADVTLLCCERPARSRVVAFPVCSLPSSKTHTGQGGWIGDFEQHLTLT